MTPMTRKEFIAAGAAAAATAALAAPENRNPAQIAAETKFIDIHAHCTEYSMPPILNNDPPLCVEEELIGHYDRIGIERGCILGLGTPENFIGGMSNESILRLAAKNPRFIPFCAVDPRACGNTPFANLRKILEHYRERGCRGVGELCANIHLLDPRMQNLFAACQDVGFSVTFHMSPLVGLSYGVVDEEGLPELEECLRRFPKLRFFGHSAAFWSEMVPCRTVDERNRRGNGKVSVEGAVPRLMRKYPNLYGDLSAGSGYFALARDREYAAKFLTEFENRIMFGIDICCPHGYVSGLPGFLRDMCAKGEISTRTFLKVARENQIRELGIEV